MGSARFFFSISEVSIMQLRMACFGSCRGFFIRLQYRFCFSWGYRVGYVSVVGWVQVLLVLSVLFYLFIVFFRVCRVSFFRSICRKFFSSCLRRFLYKFFRFSVCVFIFFCRFWKFWVGINSFSVDLFVGIGLALFGCLQGFGKFW